TGHDLVNIGFVATALPRISVTSPPSISEDAGFTNLYTITRAGPVDQPLTVLYRLGGTATAGRDYVRPFVDRVTIPDGDSSVSLSLDVQDDGVGEPDETIVLEIAYPVQEQRI